MTFSRVALAGATGYLGRFTAHCLRRRGITTRVIVRDARTCGFDPDQFEIVQAQATHPEELRNALNGCDALISCLGITRQKDGLTYMDVDFGANVHLLREAERAGVHKMVYVSVLNGRQMRNLQICDAKERFVDSLQASSLDFTVIRPNGFFSDMKDFLQMAERGSVFLFGKGEQRLNPIHGADLAEVCVDALFGEKKEIEVGGPDILSHRDIAALACEAWGKKTRLICIPDWVRRFAVWFLRSFTSKRFYGPYEFFLSAMAADMIAPAYGRRHLADCYREEVRRSRIDSEEKRKEKQAGRSGL